MLPWVRRTFYIAWSLGHLRCLQMFSKNRTFWLLFIILLNLFFSYLKKTAHEISILSQSFNSNASGRPWEPLHHLMPMNYHCMEFHGKFKFLPTPGFKAGNQTLVANSRDSSSLPILLLSSSSHLFKTLHLPDGYSLGWVKAEPERAAVWFQSPPTSHQLARQEIIPVFHLHHLSPSLLQNLLLSCNNGFSVH